MVHPLTLEMQMRVSLEGYSIHLPPGKQRMRWFRQAWKRGEKLYTDNVPLTPMVLVDLAHAVDPEKNVGAFRLSRKAGKVHPSALSDLMFGLCKTPPGSDSLEIADWLTLFAMIDPFVAGTQRVALVMEAWFREEFNPTEFMRLKHP